MRPGWCPAHHSWDAAASSRLSPARTQFQFLFRTKSWVGRRICPKNSGWMVLGDSTQSLEGMGCERDPVGTWSWEFMWEFGIAEDPVLALLPVPFCSLGIFSLKVPKRNTPGCFGSRLHPGDLLLLSSFYHHSAFHQCFYFIYFPSQLFPSTFRRLL